MTDRELMALGFTPKGDGSLHSPARVVLTPTGDAYFRLSIELPSGDVLSCHVAKVALKIKREEVKS